MTDCTLTGHSWSEGDRCANCGVFVPGDCHMETASGLYLDLAAPAAASIVLDDVAHGLAHVCRYAGQVKRFYSVAEHAYLVAQRLRATGHSVSLQLAGLHHDDAEAFVGDNTRPLKNRVPELKALEATVFAEVVAALALGSLSFDDPAVKAADNWALAAEAYQLLPSKGETWFSFGLYDPDDTQANPFIWTFGIGPRQAERIWLEHHYALCDEAGLSEVAA